MSKWSPQSSSQKCITTRIKAKCLDLNNRENGRAEVFHKDGDYASFLQGMAEANERWPLRILGYALLPNHFHFGPWAARRWRIKPLDAVAAHIACAALPPPLSDWPIPCPGNWLDQLNSAQTKGELEAVRRSIARGAPFGDEQWPQRTANRLDLESSLRPRARPRKK